MGPPTLTVLLDNGTGTFPFDITAKVMALDGYEISRGREDWIGAVTAGELRLTLNNSDGRFTPGSTILATPSPITVDQRIRLKETVNGVTYTRFTGYIKSWPVAWPAVVTSFSTVQVTATDAQARAERRPLRSMLEEEILLDSPSFYYTLGEGEDAVAAGDTSGNQYPSLTPSNDLTGGTAPVGFGQGTGPGVDGLPAVMFSNGFYLAAYSNTSFISLTGASSPWTLEAVVAVPASGSARVLVLPSAVELVVTSGGVLTTGNPFSQAPYPYMDGTSHHIAATFNGTTGKVYLDGVEVGSASDSTDNTPAPQLLVVGNGATSTMSHVAGYSTALSAARILAHAQALTGPVESADARIARIAGYAGLATGTLDASETSIPAVAVSGKSAAEAIQDIADTELGAAFIDGSGNLVFHDRDRVPAKTAPDLILSSQWVTPDVAPVVDDQQIVNYVEGTAAGTGAKTLVVDTASATTHGRYPLSTDYLVLTDTEVLSRAQWIIGNFAQPTPRYGTLTINLYGMTPAQASSVLAAIEVDCWLRVTSLASQNPGGTVADVVVQGWHEEATAETWTITCNVVSHSLYAPVWVLGTSHLGTDTRLYV